MLLLVFFLYPFLSLGYINSCHSLNYSPYAYVDTLCASWFLYFTMAKISDLCCAVVFLAQVLHFLTHKLDR